MSRKKTVVLILVLVFLFLTWQFWLSLLIGLLFLLTIWLEPKYLELEKLSSPSGHSQVILRNLNHDPLDGPNEAIYQYVLKPSAWGHEKMLVTCSTQENWQSEHSFFVQHKLIRWLDETHFESRLMLLKDWKVDKIATFKVDVNKPNLPCFPFTLPKSK